MTLSLNMGVMTALQKEHQTQKAGFVIDLHVEVGFCLFNFKYIWDFGLNSPGNAVTNTFFLFGFSPKNIL